MSRLSYTCSVNGAEVDGSVDSAQNRASPVDASDLMAVYDSARTAASASSTTPVTCSRIIREKPRQSEDSEWIHKRMTPSCKQYGWDLNHVVSYDRWTWNYVGKGTVVDEKTGEKREVYNPLKRWSGTIASCASLDESSDLRITDSVMNAVQRMAYYQADGDNSDLDVDKFLCRIESIPRL